MNGAADQYHIIAAGAGWMDRRARGRLRFAGRDVVPFLQALLTNDVQPLASGRSVYATYLTPQGRMIADLLLHPYGDAVLADVADATTAEALARRFDQLIFAEDVRVEDATGELAHATIAGHTAAAVLAAACRLDPPMADELAVLPAHAQMRLRDALIVRRDDPLLPSYDTFLRSPDFDAFVQALGNRGAVAIDSELAEALRIEAARPLFGLDMTSDTIPLEAGLLDRAISTSKGCYVGQEVIVRVLHRGGGRVVRRLVKLAFDRSVTLAPPPGTRLLDQAKEVGSVTSAVFSPVTSRVVALGYVHRGAAEVGRSLAARIDDHDFPVEIAALAS